MQKVQVRFVLLVTLLLMTLGGCASAAPAEHHVPTPRSADGSATTEETVADLTGSRRYAGDAAERKRVVSEIDEVTAKMTMVAAGVARQRLMKANAIPEHLSIVRDGARLTVTLEDRIYTAPLSGATVEVTGLLGDTLTMSFSIKDGKLEQRFVGPDGGRVNTFAPGANGKIQVFVRVFSKRLPDDLRYALTYRLVD